MKWKARENRRQSRNTRRTQITRTNEAVKTPGFVSTPCVSGDICNALSSVHFYCWFSVLAILDLILSQSSGSIQFGQFVLCSIWTSWYGVEMFTRLIEQGLTSHQTHYRSYRGRFVQVMYMIKPIVSQHTRSMVFVAYVLRRITNNIFLYILLLKELRYMELFIQGGPKRHSRNGTNLKSVLFGPVCIFLSHSQ